ncbi:MAG: hypothetical protein ACU0CC_05255 [Sagittula sp.]|jgi:uncharacterized membrane protein|uniref:hypothetical protein n=1 Tax=unclassified Sagittula TaxID=2624628 RepID=UPI0018E1FA13|nr:MULTISPECIES: hypothetical protein [unclassified Sagittula]WHZ37170.1 hypothetical protein QNI11_09135 [Sagittula sp. MA-2]
MPVTSFAMIVCSAICAAVLALWALSSWGILPVVPILLVLVLIARWAMAPVPYDDSTSS